MEDRKKEEKKKGPPPSPDSDEDKPTGSKQGKKDDSKQGRKNEKEDASQISKPVSTGSSSKRSRRETRGAEGKGGEEAAGEKAGGSAEGRGSGSSEDEEAGDTSKTSSDEEKEIQKQKTDTRRDRVVHKRFAKKFNRELGKAKKGDVRTLPLVERAGRFGSGGKSVEVEANFVDIVVRGLPSKVFLYRVCVYNKTYGQFLEERKRAQKEQAAPPPGAGNGQTQEHVQTPDPMLPRDQNHNIFWSLARTERAIFGSPQDLYSLVYDGGNALFSLRKLRLPNNQNSHIIEEDVVDLYEQKPRRSMMELSLVSEVELNVEGIGDTMSPTLHERGPLHFVSLLIHQSQTCPLPQISPDVNNYHMAGRGLYFIPSEEEQKKMKPLGEGLVVWNGLHTAVNVGTISPSTPKLLLNVDMLSSAFLLMKLHLVDLMCVASNMRPQRPGVEEGIPEAMYDKLQRMFTGGQGKQLLIRYQSQKPDGTYVHDRRVFRGFGQLPAEQMFWRPYFHDREDMRHAARETEKQEMEDRMKMLMEDYGAKKQDHDKEESDLRAKEAAAIRTAAQTRRNGKNGIGRNGKEQRESADMRALRARAPQQPEFQSPFGTKMQLRVARAGHLYWVEEMSVSQYRKSRGQDVAYPKLKTVRLGRVGDRRKANDIHAVLDECHVHDPQKYGGKLNEKQTAEMIKAAALRPQDRRDKILGMLGRSNIAKDPWLKAWGASVDLRLVHVAARVLAPPSVSYKDARTNRPMKAMIKDGVWKIPDTGPPGQKRLTAHCWKAPQCVDGISILYFGAKFKRLTASKKDQSVFQHSREIKALEAYATNLVNYMGQFGLPVVNNPYREVIAVGDERNVPEAVKYCVSESRKSAGCNLLLCVVPSRGHKSYQVIKQTAELSDLQEMDESKEEWKGIMTQCCTEKTMNENKGMTMTNICLKLCMKFGGFPHRLDGFVRKRTFELLQRDCLILGLDVIHPGAQLNAGKGRDKKKSSSASSKSSKTKTSSSEAEEEKEQWTAPSLGAVVGNVDLEGSIWMPTIRVQKRNTDHMIYLGESVAERLRAYFRNTGVKPSRIIVYRDGIAEGEFRRVMFEEILAIKTACKLAVGKQSEKYEPMLTYIVAQKRHHTKFFPLINGPMIKSGNILPGTTVDTQVIDPKVYDFYQCAHYGIQGTSKPTHYYVLHDDNNIDPDDLYELTYALCHQFARCTRSVSIPAPVYYAHIACERAKHHLGGFEQFDDTSSVSDVTSRMAMRRAAWKAKKASQGGKGDGSSTSGSPQGTDTASEGVDDDAGSMTTQDAAGDDSEASVDTDLSDAHESSSSDGILGELVEGDDAQSSTSTDESAEAIQRRLADAGLDDLGMEGKDAREKKDLARVIGGDDVSEDTEDEEEESPGDSTYLEWITVLDPIYNLGMYWV